jgi:hypothetical protein
VRAGAKAFLALALLGTASPAGAALIAVEWVFVSTILQLGVTQSSPTASAAVHLGFHGNFTLSDSAADADTFRETLSFDNPHGANAGVVTTFFPTDPSIDPLFADAGFETIGLPDLTLDPANPHAFLPTTYPGGFGIFDDDGTPLLTADLEVQSLVVDGSTASVNPPFAINLTNLFAAPGYVSGSSLIIDAFLGGFPPPFGGLGGSLNLTLQTPGDFASVVAAGGEGSSFTGTYSGSAAPTAPIPEPASIALVAAGLAGLARAGRSR